MADSDIDVELRRLRARLRHLTGLLRDPGKPARRERRSQHADPAGRPTLHCARTTVTARTKQAAAALLLIAAKGNGRWARQSGAEPRQSGAHRLIHVPRSARPAMFAQLDGDRAAWTCACGHVGMVSSPTGQVQEAWRKHCDEHPRAPRRRRRPLTDEQRKTLQRARMRRTLRWVQQNPGRPLPGGLLEEVTNKCRAEARRRHRAWDRRALGCFEMANRFWVGGTATWDGTAGSKWSTTSGGAGGAAVPTSADDVFFNASSGSGTTTVNTTRVCRSLSTSGFTGNITGGTRIDVGDASGGALTVGSGMGTFSTPLSLISSSTNGGVGWSITTNGKSLSGSLTFNNSSGKWTFQDALTTSSSITLTSGTLDSNGMSVSCLLFSGSGSTTRTLTLGASTWTCTTTGTAWSTGTVTNLTITTNTATVTASGAGCTVSTGTTNYNGTSFVMTGAGTVTWAGLTTVANLTRTGTAAKTDEIVFSNNVTITNTLTLAGNSVTNRLMVRSSTFGNRVLTVTTTVSINNADLRDITAAGTASWDLSAGSVGDCRGNAGGMTFTTAQTNYWVGGSGNMSDAANHWANSSGGTAGTGRFPLPQDTGIFDANSTSSAMVVTSDMPRMGNIDWTGATAANATWNSSGQTMEFYRGLTLVPFSRDTWTQPVFAGKNSSITLNGRSLPSIEFDTQETYTIQDALICATFTITEGLVTLTASLTCLNFVSSGSTTRTFTPGSNTITMTAVGTSTVWNVVTTNLTMDASGATLVIANPSTGSRPFIGGGATYGTLTYTVNDSPGALVISGANTFGTINVSGGHRIVFPASTTTTVTNWNVSGEDFGYLDLPFSVTDYVTFPDAPALSILGSIDLRMRVALVDWTPSATYDFTGKSRTGQHSYGWGLNTDGTMYLTLSSDGATFSIATCSEPTGFSNDQRAWVAVTWDNVTNDCKFWTADGDLEDPVFADFSQLGDTETHDLTAIHDSTSALETGNWGSSPTPMSGDLYRLQIRDGVDGILVYDVDFTKKPVGADTLSTHIGAGGLLLSGASGHYASAPDSVAVSVTGDLTLEGDCAANDWTPAAFQALLCKEQTTATRSYRVDLDASGNLRFVVSDDGTSNAGHLGIASVPLSLTNGERLKWRICYRASDGRVRFYSHDGSQWNQIDVDQTIAPLVTSIHDNNSEVAVGARLAGTSDRFQGVFYRATVYAADLGTGSGTPVFDANFASPGDMHRFTFTESSSNAATVTINGASSTITGSLAQVGDGRVAIESSSAGTAATLSKSSGTVTPYYLSVKDSAATGGATWYAVSSVNVSGNTGWIFSTLVELAETAAGTDTIGSVTAGIADDGVGADDVSVALEPTDVGTGIDTLVNVLTTIADTGAGVEAITLAGAINIDDTASGADNIIVTIGVAETGSGSDNAGVTVGFADTGTGVDDLTVAALVDLADTGVGADAVSVTLVVADTGTGDDNAAVTVGIDDTGTAVDDMGGSVLANLAESGAGVEDLLLSMLLAETAAGTDAMGVQVGVADIAVGEDGPIAVTVAVGDQAAGADNLGSLTFTLGDTADGTDVTAVAITLTDTATGVDTMIAVLGLAVRGTTVTMVVLVRSVEMKIKVRSRDMTMRVATGGEIYEGTNP